MTPEELRELIQELAQAVTLAMESGEQLPDELLAQIAQTLELLYNKLEESEATQVAPIPTRQSQLEPGPYPSSNINAFKYDPKSNRLFVQFHGPYPQAAGSIYSYENVPAYIYDIFSKGRVGPKTSGANRYHRWIRGVTPSLGASMNALIKQGGYQYQKLT